MIGVIITFLLGIANFAMHRAVVESNHPFVRDSKLHFGRHFGKMAAIIWNLAFCSPYWPLRRTAPGSRPASIWFIRR